MNRLEDGFRKELNGQPLIPKLVKTSLKVFGILSGSPGNPEKYYHFKVAIEAASLKPYHTINISCQVDLRLD